MTEMNKFNTAAAVMQGKMQNAGFRKGMAAVNLMQELSKRGVVIAPQSGSIEK